MKRKRFIKLLMGVYCMPRNAARKCAEHVQRRGGEYLPEILKCETILQQFAREYSLPISLLLSREKGLDKSMRKFLKSNKQAAAQLTICTHQNKPAPGAMVTVRVGRSNDQQDTGGAAV